MNGDQPHITFGSHDTLESELGAERRLCQEIAQLRERLEEAEAVIEAIRKGSVDAVVVTAPCETVFTLEGADRPYHRLVDAMPQGVAIVDRQGLIRYCNPYFSQLVSLPIETVCGAFAVDLLVPAERTWEEIVRALQAAPIQFEGCLSRADGSAIPVVISVSQLPMQQYCMVVTDLRSQKQVEELLASREALRLSEAFARNVLEASPDCLNILDTDGRTEFINANGCKLMEIDDVNLYLGRPWRSFWPTHFQESVVQAIASAQSGKTVRFEGSCPTLQGTPKWWEVALQPAFDSHGTCIRIIACSRDITERRANEEALQSSERVHRIAFDQSPTGMVYLDTDLRFLKVNQEMCRLTGYAANELLQMRISDILYPENLTRENELLEALLRGEASACELEKRYLTKQGEVRWGILTANPITDPAGELLHTLTVVRDVTDRKLAEQERTDAHALLHTLLSAAPIGMCYFDRDLRFVHINERMAEMNGVSAQDHIGKTVYEFVPSLLNEASQLARRVLETGKPITDQEVSGETVSAPGATRYWNESWYPVRGSLGEITGFGVLAEEITERKRRDIAIAFLGDFTNQLIALSTVDEISQVASERVGKHLRLDYCAVVAIDLASPHAIVMQDYSLSAQETLIGKYPLGDYFPDESARQRLSSGKTIAVAEGPASDSKRSAIGDATDPAYTRITVPFLSAGQWIFALDLQRSQPCVWRSDEIELLQAVTDRLFLRLQRAQAEQDLSTRNRHLALLAQTTQELISGEKTNTQILESILEELASTIDADICFSFLMGDTPETLRLTTSAGLTPEQQSHYATVQFGQCLCGKVAQKRERLVVEDLQNSVHEDVVVLARAGITCYAGFPLVAHGELIGTVAFASRKHSHYYPGELQLIQTVCDQLATALERCQFAVQRRESEDRYRALFESIDEGFCIIEMIFDSQQRPTDYRFIQANPAMERMSGLQDVIGKTASELVPDLEGFWSQTFGRVAITGKARRFERYSVSLGRWFDVYASRIGDEASRRVALVFNDITQRKSAEQAMQSSESFVRGVLDSLPEHVVVLDQRGVVTMVNEPWKRFAVDNGGNPNELSVGSNYLEVCAQAAAQGDLHAGEIYKGLHDVINGSQEQFSAEYPCHSSEKKQWFLLHARRPLHGSPGVIVSHVNISDRKKAEEILRQLAEKLSDADLRKDQFLATLAHELRNPLAPIRTGLQLLRMQGNSIEETAEIYSLIERQVKSLVRLVDDLMDVSRITTGKVKLHKQHVTLAEIFHNAVETSRPLINEFSHDLQVVLPADEVTIDADPVRLSQVILNLLNNSAKYSEPRNRIWLSGRRDAEDVVISVRDNGMGIATEKLPRVFDMFSQIDNSLEKSQGGLGIGLSLVKRLVELHGGSIVAESAGLGTGSEFILRIPCVVNARQEEIPHFDLETGSMQQQPTRVLIADDNVDALNMLAMLLKVRGNEVFKANDGLQAVELASQMQPDVILLDIGMPGLNGYDACRAIRAQAWSKSAIIVALTGWSQDEDKKQSQDAGFNFHLVKPVDIKDLDELIASTRSS